MEASLIRCSSRPSCSIACGAWWTTAPSTLVATASRGSIRRFARRSMRPPRRWASCFTGDHRIVLVTLNGTDWSLPGGSPEPGETLQQTLAREVREEACARVIDSSYIGCQRVEELDGDRLPTTTFASGPGSNSKNSGPSTR
jgi:NUDIX domain